MDTPFLLDTVVLGTSSNFLIKMAVNAIALLIAAFFLDGVQVKGFTRAFIVAFILALLNATIGDYLADSFDLLQVGLFSFVTDAIVIMLASYFLDGFKVKSFVWALVLAVALALINAFLFKFLA